MTRGKAEDAGGLTPAKDDNAAPYHFDRRTLPIFKCVDYKQALSRVIWMKNRINFNKTDPSSSERGRKMTWQPGWRSGMQTLAVSSKQFSVNCLAACFKETKISRMCLLMMHSISLVLLISI